MRVFTRWLNSTSCHSQWTRAAIQLASTDGEVISSALTIVDYSGQSVVTSVQAGSIATLKFPNLYNNIACSYAVLHSQASSLEVNYSIFHNNSIEAVITNPGTTKFVFRGCVFSRIFLSGTCVTGDDTFETAVTKSHWVSHFETFRCSVAPHDPLEPARPVASGSPCSEVSVVCENVIGRVLKWRERRI
jgi:hypothetical protein